MVGDVNSTLACALVASKMPARPLIAHVEAGLRSFDRTMPEEINRILTDRISDLLFVTEESAIRNLRAEGVRPDSIYFAGNTMIDSLREHETAADLSSVLEELGVKANDYVLLTLHRAANVDDRNRFIEILEGLSELAASCHTIFPAHPRAQKRILELQLEHYFSAPGKRGIQVVDPQRYLDFVCLMKNARLVITDSGGVQEETTALGVPCVTVRDNTERPITIERGTNLLGGTRRESIRSAIRRQLTYPRHAVVPEMWDGRAGSRIVGVLAEKVSHAVRESAPPSFGQVEAVPARAASASGQM